MISDRTLALKGDFIKHFGEVSEAKLRTGKGKFGPYAFQVNGNFEVWTRIGPEDKKKSDPGKVAPCKYWSG